MTESRIAFQQTPFLLDGIQCIEGASELTEPTDATMSVGSPKQGKVTEVKQLPGFSCPHGHEKCTVLWLKCCAYK